MQADWNSCLLLFFATTKGCRKVVWDLSSTVSSLSWLIIGDFNEIRGPEKRQGQGTYNHSGHNDVSSHAPTPLVWALLYAEYDTATKIKHCTFLHISRFLKKSINKERRCGGYASLNQLLLRPSTCLCSSLKLMVASTFFSHWYPRRVDWFSHYKIALHYIMSSLQP